MGSPLNCFDSQQRRISQAEPPPPSLQMSLQSKLHIASRTGCMESHLASSPKTASLMIGSPFESFQTSQMCVKEPGFMMTKYCRFRFQSSINIIFFLCAAIFLIRVGFRFVVTYFPYAFWNGIIRQPMFQAALCSILLLKMPHDHWHSRIAFA